MGRGQLACVHCGQENDAALRDPKFHFRISAAGRDYVFAQCNRCHQTFKDTGYFVMRSVIGGYPDSKRERALVDPASSS